MSNDRSAEAREGLLDSVAGKAKEVAGAVTGKDDLVQEGQLQQAGARRRIANQLYNDGEWREAERQIALAWHGDRHRSPAACRRAGAFPHPSTGPFGPGGLDGRSGRTVRRPPDRCPSGRSRRAPGAGGGAAAR